jgi:predicted amidohydrolase
VANWPATRKSAWETLLPARAVENLCYAAGVNRTGTDGAGTDYAGGSMGVDYLGTRLAVGGTANEVLRLTLSGAKLMRYREKFPAWKDADDFHIDGTRT